MSEPAAGVMHDGQMGQVLVELGKLSVQVAVIQTKQDALRDTISALPIPDHESRLRALERFKWVQLGGWLTSGAGSGIAAELLIRAMQGR